MSYTAKSVIFDFSSHYGSTRFMAVRSIEFVSSGTVIPLTSEDFSAYATSSFSDGYAPWMAFDTTLSKTGSWSTGQWLGEEPASTTNGQRLVIVFDEVQNFDSIVINNSHSTGASTDSGVKRTKVYISPDAIISTVFDETIQNKELIFQDVIPEHAASDVEDPFTLTNLWASVAWEGVGLANEAYQNDHSSFGGARAFDSILGSQWHSATNSYPKWIQYEFSEPQLITRIGMYPRPDYGTRMPKDFVIKGSNSGEFAGEEVDIITYVGHTSYPLNQFTNFTFNNNNKYLYYRVYITAGGGDGYQNIMEIKMMAAMEDTIDNASVYVPPEPEIIEAGRLSINVELVPSDATNFPMYVNLAHLPEVFWQNVRTDGGDIRIYLEHPAQVPLAREVVWIDVTNKQGELYVKVPNLSSTQVTYLYFFCNGASEEPAFDSLYGRNAVWTSYKVVHHLSAPTLLPSDNLDDAFTSAFVDTTLWSSVTGEYTINTGGDMFRISSSRSGQRDYFSLSPNYRFTGDFDIYFKFEVLSHYGNNSFDLYFKSSDGDHIYIIKGCTHTNASNNFRIVAYNSSWSTTLHTSTWAVNYLDTGLRVQFTSATNTLTFWAWSPINNRWEWEGSTAGHVWALGKGLADFKFSAIRSGDVDTGELTADIKEFVAVSGEYEWKLPKAIDSTGNGHDAGSLGDMTMADSITGIVGKATNFDGADDAFESTFDWHPTKFSASIWANPAVLYNYASLMGAGGSWGTFVMHTAENGAMYVGTALDNRFDTSELPSGTMATDEWQLFHYTFDSGTAKMFKNATKLATKSQTSPAAWTGFRVSSSLGSTFNGALSSAKVAYDPLSEDFITTEYNNQLSPETFYSVTAPRFMFSGNLYLDGEPVSRMIRLHERSTGKVLDEKWSDAENGRFELYTYEQVLCYLVFMPNPTDNKNMLVKDAVNLAYVGYN